MKITKTNKKILLTFFTIIFSQLLMAQGPEGLITQWGTSIKTALDAAVLVFALVGGFLIFIQYMQGNQQAQGNFVKFVIGLAIFGMVDLIAGVFIGGTT